MSQPHCPTSEDLARWESEGGFVPQLSGQTVTVTSDNEPALRILFGDHWQEMQALLREREKNPVVNRYVQLPGDSAASYRLGAEQERERVLKILDFLADDTENPVAKVALRMARKKVAGEAS